MSKQDKNLQYVLNMHKNVPLPPEYKTVFFDYIKLFYKYMEPCNHALDGYNVAVEAASTAAALRKLEEMRDHAEEMCWTRDGILVVLSMMLYIGFTRPTTSTLEKFKKLYNIIDDALLLRLAILQRYKRTITSHIRLSMKGLEIPMSFGEIQKLPEWPEDKLMDCCYINGQKILNIGAR